MSDHPHVRLGRHSLPVYDQPPARIIRRLGRVRDALAGSVGAEGVNVSALLDSLGDRLYFVVETFVPNITDLYPVWEFSGYPSPAHFESKEYDEREDQTTGEHDSLSPTFPQLLEAFDVIVEVNGGKRFLDLLGKVVELEMLKPELTAQLLEIMEARSGSPSLPGTNGTSTPTNSGATSPTKDESDTKASAANGASSSIPQPA